MPNKHRQQLIRAIENNGGYSRVYHERWALAWNVKTYHVSTDADHIREVAIEHCGPCPPLTPAIEWDENQQFEWALESAREGLTGDDTYRACSPEVAKQFGLDPGEYYRVKYGFAGRCGGYAVMREFEGEKLGVSSQNLVEAIGQDPRNYPNAWCRKLLAMITELDQYLTPKTASAEVEYQMAYRLHGDLCTRGTAWRQALVGARAARAVRRLAQVLAAPMGVAP